ncbi:MAG: HTH domain-containing protein [Deltaproteobacteria bacterium]|nr:MAG: HTH domain-containing protein [Deltaproteobacteria bacterium]
MAQRKRRKKKAKGSDHEHRGELIVRIFRLIELLVSGPVDVTELSEELGVSTRTVYRDLDALERAGIPIERQQDGRSTWMWVTKKNARKALGI